MDIIEELNFILKTATSSSDSADQFEFSNNYGTVIISKDPEWQINLKVEDKNRRIVEIFKNMLEEMDDHTFIKQCEKCTPAFLNYLDELLENPTDYTKYLIEEFLAK